MTRKDQRSRLVEYRNGVRVPMTAKDQRSRALVLYRDTVCSCARLFQDAVKARERGADDHANNLSGHANARLVFLLGWYPKNLGKVLRDIALAVEGKFHGKNQKLDDIFIDAWLREVRSLEGKKHITNIVPESGKFYARVEKECDRKRISPPPTRYAVKRRMKQLGKPLRDVRKSQENKRRR